MTQLRVSVVAQLPVASDQPAQRLVICARSQRFTQICAVGGEQTGVLLILDEPTAALDARAEFEVFQRFAELTGGRMAVLISHRFSTVRMADRILVLTGGELVEQGSHEALVSAGGLYAELFGLQAAGYR